MALVLLAQQAGATVGSGAAGAMVDRLGSRATASAGLLTSGAAVFALALALTPAALVAAAAVYGLAASGWRLALQAAVSQGLATAGAANASPSLRARAFGQLVWVSNVGAIGSGAAVAAGLPIRWAFAAQGVLLIAAAIVAQTLPRAGRAAHAMRARGAIERRLWFVAAAFAPATIIMFQAFSGLAVVLDGDEYRTMVLVNAFVLVTASPLLGPLASRFSGGALLSASTFGLGAGIGAAIALGEAIVTTLAWTLAELVVISLAPAVVAGIAPHALVGRHQAAFQVFQGAVAALAMLVGPLVGEASPMALALSIVVLGVGGAAALLATSNTLGAALAQPVACPCGALRCRCDASHRACASPSPVLVHAWSSNASAGGAPERARPGALAEPHRSSGSGSSGPPGLGDPSYCQAPSSHVRPPSALLA